MSARPPSSVLPRLFELYRKHAQIKIVSGLNPYHFGNYRDAPFTRFVKNGSDLTSHLGVSMWEVLMLQDFCAALEPSSIFIVGNGLGWSALALSLINPTARVLAIDPENGIELTNRIAQAEGLDCRAVRGWSPDDTRRVIDEYGGKGPPDLVLIDGLHDTLAVIRDFCAAFEISGERACYLFHDVVNFGLEPAMASISSIAGRCGMRTAVLAATPSGMAAVYPLQASEAFLSVLNVYQGSHDCLKLIAKEANSSAFSA
jgi:Methyltransferase domain